MNGDEEEEEEDERDEVFVRTRPCALFSLFSSLRGTLVPFQVHKHQGRQAEGPGTGRDSFDTTHFQIIMPLPAEFLAGLEPLVSRRVRR